MLETTYNQLTKTIARKFVFWTALIDGSIFLFVTLISDKFNGFFIFTYPFIAGAVAYTCIKTKSSFYFTHVFYSGFYASLIAFMSLLIAFAVYKSFSDIDFIGILIFTTVFVTTMITTMAVYFNKFKWKVFFFSMCMNIITLVVLLSIYQRLSAIGLFVIIGINFIIQKYLVAYFYLDEKLIKIE